MKHKPSITLPNFSLPMLHGPIRCTQCKSQISERHIVAAGIRQRQDGSLCFAYDFRCSSCQTPGSVHDIAHVFTRPDWWNQLAEWYLSTPSVTPIDQLPSDDQSGMRTLPKIGAMIIDIDGLESICIRGGYRGDAGPVILIYEGTAEDADFGVLRLERNHKIRFCNLDRSCVMSPPEMARFAALPDRGSFELHRHTWIKMPVADIKDIIADNVFGVLVEDGDPVTTVAPQRRRVHGTHTPKSRKRNRRLPIDSPPLDS